MILGNLDIIGDPSDDGDRLHLVIRPVDQITFTLDADQTERLITYLKGLRDGLGWNRKAPELRSR